MLNFIINNYILILVILIILVIILYFTLNKIKKNRLEQKRLNHVKIFFYKKVGLVPVIIESIYEDINNFSAISEKVKYLYSESLRTDNVFKLLEFSLLIDREIKFIKTVSKKYKLHKTNGKFLYSSELFQKADANFKRECKKLGYEF